MPEWADRREFYLRQGRLADQAHEDMLTGRVLDGLGLKRTRSPVTLSRVEQAVLGMTRGSLPAWPRVQEIFTRLIGRSADMRVSVFARMWKPQSALIVDHNAAHDMITASAWDLETARPLLFTRKKGTEVCRTYTLWGQHELPLLKPPFTVLPDDRYPQWLFVHQDVAHFVEQFGPYYVQVDG